jgi:hypothetical protein
MMTATEDIASKYVPPARPKRRPTTKRRANNGAASDRLNMALMKISANLSVLESIAKENASDLVAHAQEAVEEAFAALDDMRRARDSL